VGTKRLQNETITVKRGFGSDVEPHLCDKQTNKQTNAHLQMCIR